jgi:hypothetical protein
MTAAWLHPGLSGRAYSLVLAGLVATEGLSIYGTARLFDLNQVTTAHPLLYLGVSFAILVSVTMVGLRCVLAVYQRSSGAWVRLGACLGTAWACFVILAECIWLAILGGGSTFTSIGLLNVLLAMPAAFKVALFFSAVLCFMWAPLGVVAYILLRLLAPGLGRLGASAAH